MEEESKMGMWLEKVMPKFFLFIIRLVETFAASIVPSVISVVIIFFAPSPKAWSVLSAAVFAVTIAVNWYFWMDFAIRRDNIKEFYIVNGAVYAIYICASVIGYHLLGYLVYSMTFANLRFMEVFDVKTLYSSFIANGITAAVMVLCERCSRLRIAKLLENAALNAADKAEIKDERRNIPATKRNEIVTPLSAEELEREIEKDNAERITAAKQAAESVPEEMWSDKLSKGRGGEIERVDYGEEGADTDENDFVPGSAAENKNLAYGSDSLWDPQIYKGRTADGLPVTEFDDEEYVPPSETETEPLWDESMYIGRSEENKPVMAGAYEDTDDEEERRTAAVENIGYGAESLWESGFYQGRGSNSVPERVLDLDETTAERGETAAERGETAAERGDTEEKRGYNASERYDADSLWDNIEKGQTEPEPEEAEINPNLDYEPESLWSRDMRQGKAAEPETVTHAAGRGE